MKSDLRLNFGVLEDIAEKTMKYKESLETVKEVLENVNNKIDENEGKAIDELRKGYKDINEDLDRCLEEVDDIYDIMNRYTDEMQSIITPKKKNDIMRVDRTDIWWNQQSIMEACQSVQFLRWNISTYRSFINPFADDDVVENEENNYNKMKCIWDEINSCGYKLSSYIDEMNRLFNSKIVVFENRDDDYKGEVKSRLYDKYTSGFERFIDVGSDTINFVIDTVRGFSMSIYDMLVGIVNLCKSIICLPGSAVAFVYDKITGEVPDCLKDSYEYEKNFLGGISSVVKDPTLLVEGIAQGVSDAYEEEGIAYCFGYGAGEVAQFVVGSKLASKLKGGKVKSSAFGYMDADDALRYNQYWDDVAKGVYNNPYGGKLSIADVSKNINNHYSTLFKGTEGVSNPIEYGKYSTIIDDKVKVIDKMDLPEWIGESFTDRNYRTVVTEQNITFYRTYGGGAKVDGSFVTTIPAGNRINAKINTALVPEWKNSRQYEAVIEVPKGTTINIGRVEKQYTKTGALLEGDGDQILLPQGWPSEWIKEIREVPSR